MVAVRPAAAETGDAEYRRWARKARPSPCSWGSAGKRKTYPDISGPRKSREMAARLAGKASFKLAFL